MMIGSPRFGWAFRIGRDYYRDARLLIQFGVGFRKNAPINEIPWRHSWQWSSASGPDLIFRQFYWRGLVITLPAGFRAFGRSRIFF